MKLLVCLWCLACILAVVTGLTDQQVQSEFASFVKKYGKQYSDVAETFQRFDNFKRTLERVYAHNSKQGSFQVGINEFADWTESELQAKQKGFIPSRTNSAVRVMTLEELKLRVGDLPKSVDWRKQGAVTPISNQGQCGSSPHFATIEAAEGYSKIHTGKIEPLSVQQVMDCALTGTNQGCNGAMFEAMMDYIQANGSCSAADYPYNAKDAPCITDCKPVFAGWRGYSYVNLSEEVLQYAVALGPVATACAAGMTFQDYSGGVYDGNDCPSQPSHGIAIVGYGTDKGKDYWILKNTWGDSWGEKGYMRMIRGKNLCEIKDYAISPV